MSALVAPSGECLRGDGRCADRIVGNFSAVVFDHMRAIVYILLSCVSTVVFRSILSSNNKVDDFLIIVYSQESVSCGSDPIRSRRRKYREDETQVG